MDLYPVSNRQYAGFLNDQKPINEILEKWINLKGEWAKERCSIKVKKNIYEPERGFENHPVIFISFYGAQSYAQWAKKRLPNEQEWEKGARGTDGRIYPWGNRFDKALCNSFEDKHGGTTSVDTYHEGKDPYGCYDMVGNVWEWTSSFYDKDRDTYVLRGGSWHSNQDFCRCAARNNIHPDFRSDNGGFRCAKS